MFINSRHKLSRDKSVCRILLCVFKSAFLVPIGEFFTWLNLFTQPAVVMFVTNIRCGSHSVAPQSDSVSGFSIDHDFDRRAISQWEDITGARFGPFWAFQLLALISFWWETYYKPSSQVICCQICHFRSKIDHFRPLLSCAFEKKDGGRVKFRSLLISSLKMKGWEDIFIYRMICIVNELVKVNLK